MSCTICNQITGHAADCPQGQVERAQDQEDLRQRVETLEQKVEQLTDRVLDYAHLKRLYAESRDYVRTLEGERDELLEANRRSGAEIDRLSDCLARVRDFLRGTSWAVARGSSATDATAADFISRALGDDVGPDTAPAEGVRR